MESRRYIAHSTLACIQGGCIACLYKAFPLGKASIAAPNAQEMVEGKAYPSNIRPESCTRSKDLTYNGLQSMKRRILVVGDGDLSFSLAVANSDPKRARKHLIVSSYESEASICSIYVNGTANIAALREIGVQILFEVDATNLSKTKELQGEAFDVVVFNFPCVCIDRGADGQATELVQNQALVRAFFANVGDYLGNGGEVHVTHKTIEPFSWWGLPALAADQGFRLVFDLVFDKYNYPGYTNRKALDKKSFTCNDAKTLVFTRDADKKLDEDIVERHAKRIFLFDEREVLRFAIAAGVVGGIMEGAGSKRKAEVVHGVRSSPMSAVSAPKVHATNTSAGESTHSKKHVKFS